MKKWKHLPILAESERTLLGIIARPGSQSAEPSERERMNTAEQEEARQLLQKALERLGVPIQNSAPDPRISSAPASNSMRAETISRLRTKKRRPQK